LRFPRKTEGGSGGYLHLSLNNGISRRLIVFIRRLFGATGDRMNCSTSVPDAVDGSSTGT